MVDINTGDQARPRYLVDATTGLPLAVGGTGAAAEQVQGNVAHHAVDSGNAVKVGGYATNTNRANVDPGDRVDASYSLGGAAWVGMPIIAAIDGMTNSLTTASIAADARPLLTAGAVFNGASWDRQRGDITGSFSKPPPLAHTASAVVAGSTTSQQLFAASATRSKLLIQNQDAAINVFVNLGAVATAATPSMRIAPGATLELTGTNATVNLIAASGTPAIAAWQF